MEPITCVFFAFFDFETIKQSLESLIKTNRFSISVVENMSENTNAHIMPYMLDMIEKGKIDQYFLFDRNISNNAMRIIMNSGRINMRSKYILLTDGDLLPQDGWAEEQKNIMENCLNAFACAISLSMDNLPIKNFPDANSWLPKHILENDLYIEVYTGHHLLLVKSEDLKDFIQYMVENNLKYVDEVLHRYCRIKGKKWVSTKITKAIHLTWDRYNDLQHPYTKFKLSKSLDAHWAHSDVCGYTLYTKNDTKIIK